MEPQNLNFKGQLEMEVYYSTAILQFKSLLIWPEGPLVYIFIFFGFIGEKRKLYKYIFILFDGEWWKTAATALYSR
jgi:hypothetical protein